MTFPEDDLRAILTDGLLDNVRNQASMYGTKLPSSEAELAKSSIEIDSLVVVDISIEAEPILGFEIKAERVVRQGGYGSVEEAVSDLLAKLSKEWQKHQKRENQHVGSC